MHREVTYRIKLRIYQELSHPDHVLKCHGWLPSESTRPLATLDETEPLLPQERLRYLDPRFCRRCHRVVTTFWNVLRLLLDQVARAELCLIVFCQLLAVSICLPIPRPANIPLGLDRLWNLIVALLISELVNICLNRLLDRNLRSINVPFSRHIHQNVLLSRAECDADGREKKDNLSLVKEELKKLDGV